ncbi:ribonuclease H-like domain-containing protein [Streptomyces sp. NPDC096198]|uniref:ribonuclease H-like domain-containing protein n=1 Tax=Streptomyces sp. NPDC096198 TaxID=3366080 RepID=UPI003806C141
MKILTIDIETSPSLAHVWSLWNTNVGLNQLMESGEVICFAAKWYDAKDVKFYSTFHDGKAEMIEAAHRLLEEADTVVHFNGQRFDIPHLNREFLEAELSPPAPFAQVDLLKVVKKQFRFPTNKLDYVVQKLGIGKKTAHTGHQLWVDCMKGDGDAWDLMKKYNVQDVRVTEDLYDALLPWIPTHPNHKLYDGQADDRMCPNCGSDRLKKEGRAYTSVSVFQRYRCDSCGKWSRGSKRLGSSEITSLK